MTAKQPDLATLQAAIAAEREKLRQTLQWENSPAAVGALGSMIEKQARLLDALEV